MAQLRLFFQSKSIELVLLGVVFPLMVAVPVGDWLNRNKLASATIGLIISVALVAILEWRNRRAYGRRTRITDSEAFHPRRSAVVFMVSPGRTYHSSIVAGVLERLPNVEVVGLLQSADATETARDYEQQIRSETGKRVIRRTVDDVESVAAMYNAVSGMLSEMETELGLRGEDVVVDVTHGTAFMSVVAFMAADDAGIDAQYIHTSRPGAETLTASGPRGLLLRRFHGPNRH